jgi:hypothetical protein
VLKSPYGNTQKLIIIIIIINTKPIGVDKTNVALGGFIQVG